MSSSTTYRPDLTELLINAAINNDVEKVKNVIKQGADVNAIGNSDEFQ